MKTNSKADRVAALIERKLAQNEFSEDGFLPSIRAFASSLHLSSNTVAKTYRLLEERDVLRKDPINGRYRPRDFTTPQKESHTKGFQRRTSAVSDQLREYILVGEYGGRPRLPSMRELQRVFRCSYTILRQSLIRLQSEGIIEKKGKGFARTHVVHSGSSVYLTTPRRSITSTYYNQLIQGVERALSDRGWGRLKYYFPSGAAKLSPRPQAHAVAGYIVARWREDKFVPWIEYPEIPCVVIDTEFRISPATFSHPNVVVIRPDNIRAGHEIAVHLYEQGHRKIAFLSHVSLEQPWVRNRLKAVASIFRSHNAQTDLKAVALTCTQAKTDASAADISRDTFKNIADELGNMPSMQCGLSSEVRRKMYSSALSRTRQKILLFKNCESMFDKALNDPQITAWIGVNDDIACAARMYLDMKKIDVPGRLALTGFDDIAETKVLGITTYGFRFDRIGHRAVEYLEQRTKESSKKPHIITVAGSLYPRSSTAGRVPVSP